MRRTLTGRTFSRPFGRALSFGHLSLPLKIHTRAPRESLKEASQVTARVPRFNPYVKVRNLDALLEVKRAEHNLPAVTALTLQGGQIVAKGETGLRKAGSSVVVRPADRWHIGACTKAMTATMIGALVERGELSWDTTIGEALPALRESILPIYHDVTVEMLLTQQAGLAQGYESPAAWRYIWKRQDSAIQHRKKVSGLMMRNRPVYTPGKGYAYSTMGYCIAGHLAEYVTGQAWEKLMRDFVFEPLSMQSAGPGEQPEAQQVSSPWGHQRVGVAIAPGLSADQPAAFGPGGGNLHLSITDWSKFVADQLRGARSHISDEADSLLNADTYQKLQTGIPTGEGHAYAMGWNVSERGWASPHSKRKGICLSHNGTILSWYSQVRIAPERNMAVLCATNIGDKNRGHAISIKEKLNDIACAVIREGIREEITNEHTAISKRF